MAQRSAIGLRYGNIDTMIHRLDPVTKMLILVTFMIFTFIFTDVYFHTLVLVVAFIFTFVLAKMPIKQVANPLKLLLFMLIPTVILFPLTYEWGRVGYFSWTWTLDGIIAALILSNRTATVTIASFGFLWSTHPRLLSQALEDMGVPYKIAHAFNLALVVFPVIENEAVKIRYSHTMSGIYKQTSLKSLRNFIFSLLARLLRRMNTMVLAMESRGFGSGEKRTYLAPLKKPKNYKMIRLGVLSLVIVYVAWALYTGKPLLLGYDITSGSGWASQ